MMMKKQNPAVSIIGCILAMLCVGIVYLWSVVKSSAMDYFGWTLSSANLVSSFMMFAFCIGNLIGGTLNDHFGPKKVSIAGMAMFGAGVFLSSCLPAGSSVVWFYVTYCIVGGMGSGFVYGALLSCIQKWFPHRRGFAAGLGATFFGLSTIVFSPLIGSLLRKMTVSAALRMLSVIFLVVGLAACMVVRLPGEEYLAALPKPPAKKNDIRTKRDMTLGEAAKTLPFWCLLLNVFFYNGTWNMLTPLIAPLGEARGLTSSAAILCVSLTGIFNAAGRLLMSSLSDRIGRIRTIVILCIITLICALLLTFVGGYLYFVIVLMTAFAFGGPAAVNPATTTDFFGARYSGTNYGVIMLGLGVSSVFFNAFSNMLYNATGTYTLTFIMGGATAVITIGLMAVISHCLKKQK